VLGIFLDTETNGLNAQRNKILELAYKVLNVNTGALVAEFQTIISLTEEEWKTTDASSLLITEFTWEEVASKGRPKEVVAKEILESFKELGVERGKAVFICQNPSFDRAFFAQIINPDIQEKLNWPYHWLDLASMYWAESIRKAAFDKEAFPWKTGFSKDKIAAACHLPPENKPHRAMNGVNHLLLCYESVVGFPLLEKV